MTPKEMCKKTDFKRYEKSCEEKLHRREHYIERQIKKFVWI